MQNNTINTAKMQSKHQYIKKDGINKIVYKWLLCVCLGASQHVLKSKSFSKVNVQKLLPTQYNSDTYKPYP